MAAPPLLAQVQHRLKRAVMALLVIFVGACQEECDAGNKGVVTNNVAVQILGAGTGSGLVTSSEAVVDIRCSISDGQLPNLSIDALLACQTSFLDANAAGSFNLIATPRDYNSFTRWHRDCAAAGTNPTCLVTFDNDSPRNAEGVIEIEAQAEFEDDIGTLEINTVNLSTEYVPDRSFELDGVRPFRFFSADDTRTEDVTARPYEIFLDGSREPSCEIAPPNPRTITVVKDEFHSTTFEITCTVPPGELIVTTATTGTDLDPDGYELFVWGETPEREIYSLGPIGINETRNYPLDEGSYRVRLTDIAINCTIANRSNDRFFVLSGVDDVDEKTFGVECQSDWGGVIAQTSTTGDLPDPDGYLVLVEDGGQSRGIGLNATSTFTGLPPGPRQVELLGVADNCVIAGGNPMTVTVVRDPTVTAFFEIDCPGPSQATPPVLFESNRDGDFDIYAMNPDGSGVVNLTNTTGTDIDPSWAWDNQSIVFVSDRSGNHEVWRMDPDGTNPTKLTDTAAENQDPALSPDGGTLVYEEVLQDGWPEIFSMDLATSAVVQLTDANRQSEAPQFSPDGGTILFKSDREGDFEVYLMNPDGSNLRKLTNTSVDDFDPSWSPDGSTIVFSSARATGREDIWTMNADGSGQSRLLSNTVWDWHPVYSTDGTQIIFTSDRDGEYELFRMNADGTGVEQLTDNNARDDDAEFKKPGG